MSLSQRGGSSSPCIGIFRLRLRITDAAVATEACEFYYEDDKGTYEDDDGQSMKLLLP